MDLTKSEENILEILLDSDTPLSKSGILEHALRINVGKMVPFTYC